jgi:uncharacterized protein (DUF433 family)
MVPAVLTSEPVPLVWDDAGRLMVTGTRVPLDSLVEAFKQGDAPEVIHENFDTVPLADVYAVLAYYLKHRRDVEDYLAEQERLGDEVQARMEATYPADTLRAKLMARLAS